MKFLSSVTELLLTWRLFLPIKVSPCSWRCLRDSVLSCTATNTTSFTWNLRGVGLQLCGKQMWTAMQSSEYFDGVAASMESAFGDVTLTSDDQSHNEPHKSHRPDAIQQGTGWSLCCISVTQSRLGLMDRLHWTRAVKYSTKHQSRRSCVRAKGVLHS